MPRMHRIEGESRCALSIASRHIFVVVLAALCVGALIGGLIPARLIFFPAHDQPRTVEVIMVLGPAEESRLELATYLLESGYSSNLMVSVSDKDWPFSSEAIDVCHQPQDFQVYCEHSTPFTTQGEIGWLTSLADYMNWDSALVITFEPHVSRVRAYLERCFPGESVVISDGTGLETPTDYAYQYAYQSAGYVKAMTLSSGCV